jgi:hypothetical protein
MAICGDAGVKHREAIMDEKRGPESGLRDYLIDRTLVPPSADSPAPTAAPGVKDGASDANCPKCGEAFSLHSWRPLQSGDTEVRDGIRGLLGCPTPAVSLPPVEVEAREAAPVPKVEQSGTADERLIQAIWAITAELREIRIQLAVGNGLAGGDGYPEK